MAIELTNIEKKLISLDREARSFMEMKNCYDKNDPEYKDHSLNALASLFKIMILEKEHNIKLKDCIKKDLLRQSELAKQANLKHKDHFNKGLVW